MPNTKQQLKLKNNIVSVHFDAEFFFERGIRYFHRGDVPKAYKYLRRCVDLAPEQPTYVLHLAACYTEMGHYEESNNWLSQVIQHMDSTLVDCYYYMANNYAHLGEFDEAEKFALMYIQESPDGIYAEEAEELLDFICFELDRAPREWDEENQLIKEHEKARTCLEQGKFVEATKLLERMVDEYPHFLAARNNLSLSYYYLGEFEQAMSVIDDILERDSTNLHALCNLAVFLKHRDMHEKADEIIEGLTKVQPILPDHQYKLATTLGILGQDGKAYELFLSLTKKDIEHDPSLYHYIAVALYNTQQYEKAQKVWKKLKSLYPQDEVADYYLQLLHTSTAQNREKRLSYHYQLPYDVQIKKKEWFKDGKIPTNLLQDPVIRSSLLWSLRHGDRDTKLQVIQSFQYFADAEIEEALRQFIKAPQEEEYIKRTAIFALRQMGAQPPYQAWLNGRVEEVHPDTLQEAYPEWMSQWQDVLDVLKQQMAGKYNVIEHQEAQILWAKFLQDVQPNVPMIRKPEAWAAALEYLVAINYSKKVVKKELAQRYGITLQTLSKNIAKIEKSILLDSKKATSYDKDE
ncbi:tetratricopeptide repeat protein [Caldalkalibacillus salinus]|uniref:tetratricopeptide repeat protein n=1 Tax=Caldalkalibacillus salinus TaxID=2803787 RepID=UPI00192260CB|nr:tetratricopeptide repeat protein [Caldalkalibacillus salinus]